jgi:hypothetical protein
MFDQPQKYYSQKSSYSIALHRKTHPALLVANLHKIIIIVGRTSAHNEPRLLLEPSSNTACPWRPSTIFESATFSNLPPHHPSTAV